MSEYSENSKILVSSDSTKIYADASGNPDKPSIVFVHGQALSAAVFDNIFSEKRYTDEFYLVRYDMRGHGRSDRPDTMEGYSSNLFADDFAAVMKAFNLRGPVLVGWSLGGTVGVDIATYLPEYTLSGIVYIAGVPCTGPIMNNLGTEEVLSVVAPLLKDDSVTTFVDATKPFIDSCFLDASKVPWELKCFWTGMSASLRPAHRAFALSRPQDPTRLFELGQKGLPILVLSGAHDRVVRNDKLTEELRPHFKDMEVCIIEKGGSHAVFYDNRDEVMDRIIKFVRKVNSSPYSVS